MKSFCTQPFFGHWVTLNTAGWLKQMLNTMPLCVHILYDAPSFTSVTFLIRIFVLSIILTKIAMMAAPTLFRMLQNNCKIK